MNNLKYHTALFFIPSIATHLAQRKAIASQQVIFVHALRMMNVQSNVYNVHMLYAPIRH